MKRIRTAKAASHADVEHLEDIPNVRTSIAGDLRQSVIQLPGDLPGRGPFAMYEKLCRITGQRQDPCVLDTFIAAVRFIEGSPAAPWWKYTEERKQTLAIRAESC